jgi:hypothetical protein
MSYLNQAFHKICSEAKPARSFHVSLYARVPFYGGPEEGGWWGHDTLLQASQRFDSEEAAEAAKAAVEKFAEELNEQEKKDFGDQCLREMEWLDARGLDADFLPEPDGETTYYVTIENTPGESTHRDSRVWE